MVVLKECEICEDLEAHYVVCSITTGLIHSLSLCVLDYWYTVDLQSLWDHEVFHDEWGRWISVQTFISQFIFPSIREAPQP